MVKNLPDNEEAMRCSFDPWVGKMPWRKAWQPTPVLLLGEFHRQRSLAGYSPCGCKESDTTAATVQACMHVAHLASVPDFQVFVHTRMKTFVTHLPSFAVPAPALHTLCSDCTRSPLLFSHSLCLCTCPASARNALPSSLGLSKSFSPHSPTPPNIPPS